MQIEIKRNVTVPVTAEIYQQLDRIVDLSDGTVRWCLNHPCHLGLIPKDYLFGKTQKEGHKLCSSVRGIIFVPLNIIREREKKSNEEKMRRDEIEATYNLQKNKIKREKIIKGLAQKKEREKEERNGKELLVRFTNQCRQACPPYARI